VINSSRALRALAHPIRLALLDALLERALSATEAGAEIGETATTCSYHLRQLARYGFVEESEIGPGRRRVWRRTHDRWQVPPGGYDEPLSVASRMAQNTMAQYYSERMRNAVSVLGMDTMEWQKAALGSISTFFVTPSELAAFGEAYRRMVDSFIEQWGSRKGRPDLRPNGHRRVEILLLGAPVAADQDNA
jgi:DNA-binding transcriptional ArsR family regulator